MVSRSAQSQDRRSAVIVACVLVGLTLLGVAWFGASGQTDVSEQLLWITGAGIPGVFFVGLGGVMLATGELRTVSSAISKAADHAEELHAALVDGAPSEARAVRSQADTVVVPHNAATYHRSGCALVQGKTDVKQISRKAIKRSLQPCPLCEPDTAELRTAQAGA